MAISTTASAQYYSTVPQGVRLINTRNIQSTIKSSFNHSQIETPNAFEIDAGIENLMAIDNEIVQDAISVLAPYKKALSAVSLGTHRIEAVADIDVDVFAFAYGITDRVTAYIGLPVYDANVKVKYKTVNRSSNKEVAAILQSINDDDYAQTLGNIIENFYNIDENIIQSAIVNTLGYDELGDWSAQGIGDTELGIMYNFLNEDTYGMKWTLGVTLPTGYVDDPDQLQDIGFGDGQADIFFEIGGGYRLNNKTIINAWTRYTYQAESEKSLRAPISDQVFINDTKSLYTEKLGNKIKLGLDTEIAVNDWFILQPSTTYSYTEQTRYSSNDSDANRRLAANTEASAQTVKLLAKVSTVKLFNQKKFILPAQISISQEKMVSGMNTPKVDIFEVSLVMFF